MNDLDAFESELRALRPAIPEPVSERLSQARVSVALSPASVTPAKLHFLSFPWFWWLAPATAILVAGFFTWSAHRAPEPSSPQAALLANANAAASASPGGLEVASELVSDFESVTQLESGEPVRFRYMAYVDNITLEDPRSGVKWQRRTPRVEIVPVGFDVY